MTTWTVPPGLDDIATIALAALESLPPPIRRFAEGVVVRVLEFPDEDTKREMQLESPWDLLGLYRGVPLDRRSILDVRTDVDMIFLYRSPLLDAWCESGEDLTRIVRHVLIHEIGHHFGLGDAEMQRIEDEA